MIATPRLMFRKYTLEDYAFLQQMTADAEVMRHIGRGTPWSQEETLEKLQVFIGRYQASEGLGLMVAVRRSDGALIGHAGLVPQLVEGREETEIGYWISRDYWGQGYAYEAAEGWRDYAWRRLNKGRLISIIQPDNLRSVRVARKLGMTCERTIQHKGKNVCIYSIHPS
ncbi:GNAT family N-acetyltransferase [Paenibacillus doosanensis]|uniref:GNAT family N-acetyltransferase n=1 Tax=Paenibacillus doosanensis TaxID=1229154 RepID=UPI00217FE20F|nr:GNAT family N-acetyltransferase [Paenibacillus doosanensis]MCS7458783.1 GNAT family N-acetyltransferase [Paenibacillus doosanensis]